MSKKETTYRIIVRSVNNKRMLQFSDVKGFEIINEFLVFTDSKTGRKKRFHPSNCEVEEEVVKKEGTNSP